MKSNEEREYFKELQFFYLERRGWRVSFVLSGFITGVYDA